MKSSSELQSNLVTTSLLIHLIRICDLVLKNNFVLILIRYCFNFRCLIYIDTSLYASPSFLRGRCHLARRFCTFSFIRSFLSHVQSRSTPTSGPPKVSARAPAHRSYHFRGVKLKSCIKKIHHNFYISKQANVRIKHADTEGASHKKFRTDARVQ